MTSEQEQETVWLRQEHDYTLEGESDGVIFYGHKLVESGGPGLEPRGGVDVIGFKVVNMMQFWHYCIESDDRMQAALKLVMDEGGFDQSHLRWIAGKDETFQKMLISEWISNQYDQEEDPFGWMDE